MLGQELHHDACGVGYLVDLQGRSAGDVLPLALTALGRMAHRGAVDADGRTGDGAGITTAVPYDMLLPELQALGLKVPDRADLAIGLAFLPRDIHANARARQVIADGLADEALALVGFRPVPFRDEVLGDKARRSRPDLVHVLVRRPQDAGDAIFERALFRARRRVEEIARTTGLDELYLVSLSSKTLVYKALVRANDLGAFFPDLQQAAYRTPFAVFHQRFSTNTQPSWPLVQPFRLLAHNGEINTVQGNRRAFAAREATLAAPALGIEPGDRLLSPGRSDSASLDEALELLVRGGRDLVHGLSMLVPPAWENDLEMPEAVRAFFDYQACQVEPWDGPALLAFTDGRIVGAALDRNGLRPARYVTTVDGLLLVASEVGVLDVPEERLLHRGRLGPGDMLIADVPAGRVFDRHAIHESLAARRPYGQWLAEQRLLVDTPPAAPDPVAPDPTTLRTFGYTREEVRLVLGPMHIEGREPLGSMGDDTPLAVLSQEARLLYSYFKQRFAQVTNPPIDPLRESLVMSLAVALGPRGELLSETEAHARQVHLPGPLLTADQIRGLETLQRVGWRSRRLSLLFNARAGASSFEAALSALVRRAVRAFEEGVTFLVLDDRGAGPSHAALPALLAVSAVHHELVRRGLALRASLAVETGEARDEHQIATLLGFGASVVCPWLALDLVASQSGAEHAAAAQVRYLGTLRAGLLKILAKMGISTLRSYHAAQLFEAVGLSAELTDRHFCLAGSAISGIGLADIASDTLARHAAAHGRPNQQLDEGGDHGYRRNGERHAFEPRVVKSLHAALRSGEPLAYREYAQLVHERGAIGLRDLMEFKARAPIPLSEVEPVEQIFPRFMTSAMSLGALSPEAHDVLAVAMNRIGARSNSGEGGEDGVGHRIKQVASARFGVTAEYVASAEELQIKMAQGSKPGEGGQLPAHKNTDHIARVRHAAPGITLISPPPHHDIYSIEDLAQLVYDLKRVNPKARVGVKLVSQAGIGTVAAGVAKTHADAITIGGHEGGTGASPLSSIKNAGTPWEIGLAETQQALVASGLRGRVRLQVEGGLRTGRDVVIAALLGADEFGFGSVSLIAAGCVMARQCHLNTCPAGVATQREELRRKFRGTPEDVIRFFTLVAEEVREILALLGVRRLADAIGQVEWLEAVKPTDGKASTLDLTALLAAPGEGARAGARVRNEPPETGGGLDDAVLARLPFTIASGNPLAMGFAITNADRTVGGRVAGELALRRARGPVSVELEYRGSAGQSFGAFAVSGMRLVLEGEANDAVAKGLCGGEVVVRPPASAAHGSQVLAGNAVLYGATAGRLFVAGRAGERFAVRNSGAFAIVEGVGDHACEYMTGGAVVILGSVGRNLAAGMSGGIAFVLDDEALALRCNHELVTLGDRLRADEALWLHSGLELHVRFTGSRVAAALLQDWDKALPRFRRIVPRQASGKERLEAWLPDSVPAVAPAVAL